MGRYPYTTIQPEGRTIHKSSCYLQWVERILDPGPVTFLTVDVEDYYHVLPDTETQFRPGSTPTNLADNLERLLDVFAQRQLRGTFFVLASVAPRIRQVLRRALAEGHEIASHGFGHRYLVTSSPTAFRNDLMQSLDRLQQLTGTAIASFRAPAFTITEQTLWALEILREAGIRFDSSVAPTSNYLYGIPQAPWRPHRLKNGLVEVPMSVTRFLGLRFMLGGGFYLRLYPAWLHRFLFRQRGTEWNRVLYLHPWEMDPPHLNPWDQGFADPHRGLADLLPRIISVFNRRQVLEKFMDLLAEGPDPVLAIRDLDRWLPQAPLFDGHDSHPGMNVARRWWNETE
ncbi:MAG: polysaccharide deacetylase family protein [Magnetococcales bacterium]|nr:polysaccharide deacetylase family protein [Magnetococcales bacterium]